MTRVFVVDDHDLVRDAIAQLIDAEPGLEVVGEAATASGALGGVAAALPDVVVLDMHLPDGSGIDLCRSIRSADPGVRCLILTADDDDTASVAAVIAGASGYVLKNIRGRALLEGIHRASRGESLIPRAVTDRVRESLTVQTGRLTPRVQRTPQERQVLELVSEGCTDGQIGARLRIPERTVRACVSGLLVELGLQGRLALPPTG